MARSKDERRYLTWVYQKRQIDLHETYRHRWVAGELSPKGVGRCRTMAFCDCGNPKCGLCASPRKSKAYKGTKYAKLTLQEKKQLDIFDDQMNSV